MLPSYTIFGHSSPLGHPHASLYLSPMAQEPNQRIHLIAIGGAAMHNLALELHARGHRVSGSDDQIFEPSLSRLRNAGLLPRDEGWHPEHLSTDIDLVILGMHARADNPELQRALELGLEVVSYPEYLYRASQHQTRVVIAGSHGKTTITGMLLHVVRKLQLESGYMVGAQLQGYDRMVSLDPLAEFMVLEGDEYLSSPLDPRSKFLWYKPNIALISGIAWDHANVFPTEADYHQPFVDFVKSIEPGGSLAYCAEDEALVQLVETHAKEIRLLPYHTPPFAHRSGQVWIQTEEGEVPLQIFGKHNLQNLEGARTLAHLLGIVPADFYAAISDFEGAARRLEKWDSPAGTRIYRDFAHAPSKVKATVQAVLEHHPGEPVLALLELHTFSSLKPEFLPQYQRSMDGPEAAVLFYEPEVVERKKQRLLSDDELRHAFGRQDLKVIHTPEELAGFLEAESARYPVRLLMSSGSFGNLSKAALSV